MDAVSTFNIEIIVWYSLHPTANLFLLAHYLISTLVAMIAITAFAFQEAVQKFAVADQTPIFFKPAVEVANEYGNTLGADIVGNNL